MAQVDVLLLQPVEELGHEGEQVTVKAGYARNFLLPRKLAIPVTRSNRKQLDALVRRREERLQHERDQAEARKEKIEALVITFAVKTGQGGKLFGSITNQDLHARLSENGFEVDRHKIHLESPVKELGKHTASIRLHAEVTAELGFEVFSENPIEEDGATEEAAETAEA